MKLDLLTAEQQQEVLRLVDSLVQQNPLGQSIWDKLDNLIGNVAPEVWDQLPTDGAQHHDRYLYAASRLNL